MAKPIFVPRILERAARLSSALGLQILVLIAEANECKKVFMTRKDMTCFHEPLGDAFYYGPERMSTRFEDDEQTRKESGCSELTFQDIFAQIERKQTEGKRVFLKDMIYYLVPPDDQPTQLAPSLQPRKRGIGTNTKVVEANAKRTPLPFNTECEAGNPTIVPSEILRRFTLPFLFVIRIPAFRPITVVQLHPLDEVTGFYDYYPNEAGYVELRRVFDYLCASGQVGSENANNVNGISNGDTKNEDNEKAEICVIDADDLLDDPEGILRIYCKSIGIDFHEDMLNWDNEEDHERARKAFAKWKGFHEDAIDSKDLKPRVHKKASKTEAQWDEEWKQKFGEVGAKVIRSTVDQNMHHYNHLKQFRIKV